MIPNGEIDILMEGYACILRDEGLKWSKYRPINCTKIRFLIFIKYNELYKSSER
jgi:hypothetical protein